MAALKKILLVDDESLLLDFLKHHIAKKSGSIDVKVLIAKNGQDAIAILSKETIDLIVTDLNMPGITGLDLLYRIRSQWPNIEIILMTGYCTDEVRSLAEKNGCRHIFEKPISLTDLKKTIFNILINKEKEKGFAGIVKSVNLTDLIQMFCLNGMSKSIRICNEQEEGYIHIEAGDIIHAVCGDMNGQNAFYKILGWPTGSFETLAITSDVEINIFDDWQYLLLEGARQMDESEANIDEDEPGVGNREL